MEEESQEEEKKKEYTPPEIHYLGDLKDIKAGFSLDVIVGG
ncbi:MAG: hypothetical protein FD137_836 [Spirochaetes bacterium]|nr:MAG: hypothetical protein FD137_836 [Spirochaetota bacterium]